MTKLDPYRKQFAAFQQALRPILRHEVQVLRCEPHCVLLVFESAADADGYHDLFVTQLGGERGSLASDVADDGTGKARIVVEDNVFSFQLRAPA